MPEKENRSSVKKRIYIEGNVGAGKSTFLSILQKHLSVEIMYEPHDLWQNIDGHNLLEQFFLNQKRWAYSLQSYTCATRVERQLEVEKKSTHDTLVLERSVYSDRFCFSENCYERGLMTDLEWALYKKLWDWFVLDHCAAVDGFIYLRVPAEICFERIKKRGRFEENPITLEYIQSLEKKHDQWLIDKALDFDQLKSVPVLVIDYSEDLEKDSKKQQKYVDQVTTFLQERGQSEKK